MLRERTRFLFLVLLACHVVCVCAVLADDDTIIELNPYAKDIKPGRIEVVLDVAKQVQETVDLDEFNVKVFGQSSNQEQCRDQFNRDLENVIERLDRTCQLSELQKQNLKLAGNADPRRFFDQVVKVRSTCRFDAGSTEVERTEIERLHRKVLTGVFGEDSFFCKYVSRTLTAEQAAKLDQLRRSHREQFANSILREFAMTIELQPDQRTALKQLLIDGIAYRPDFENFGIFLSDSDTVSEFILLMYQLSLISEQKVKPLLDEAQWKKCERRLREFRRFQAHLAARGVIPRQAEPVDELPR